MWIVGQSNSSSTSCADSMMLAGTTSGVTTSATSPRPLSFTRPGAQADVLVGNPPWLAYRHMSKMLQTRYQQLAKARGLWAGGRFATHQDLSDLFVTRAVEQYLRPGGRFAFVMPFAVLSRRQYAGFRSGDFTSQDAGIQAVAFDAQRSLRASNHHRF